MIKVNDKVTFKTNQGYHATGLVKKVKESGYCIVEVTVHYIVDSKELEMVTGDRK